MEGGGGPKDGDSVEAGADGGVGFGQAVGGGDSEGDGEDGGGNADDPTEFSGGGDEGDVGTDPDQESEVGEANKLEDVRDYGLFSIEELGVENSIVQVLED